MYVMLKSRKNYTENNISKALAHLIVLHLEINVTKDLYQSQKRVKH